MKRRFGAVFLAVIFPLAMSACQAGNEPSALDWNEPEWMANHRAEGMARQNALISCLTESGALPIRIHGTWGVAAGVVSDPGTSPAPHQMQSVSEVAAACQELVGPASFSNPTVNGVLYERMLDTRECLVVHGYEIPDPPSEQSWIEGEGRWNPHTFLDRIIPLSETDGLWLDMQEACPQVGPVFVTRGSDTDFGDM